MFKTHLVRETFTGKETDKKPLDILTSWNIERPDSNKA